MPKPWKHRDRSDYYLENKEKINAYRKAYYVRNKEKQAEYCRRSREKAKQRDWEFLVFKATVRLEEFRQSRLKRKQKWFYDNYGYSAELAAIKCNLWKENRKAAHPSDSAAPSGLIGSGSRTGCYSDNAHMKIVNG